MNMRRKISAVVLPVKIKLALQTPRLSLFPGQVASYKYVGFSTGNTILILSPRLCQTGTQETYSDPCVTTKAKSVYAMSIWKVRVAETEILKNDARAECREMGRMTIPIVTSQRCPVSAIAARRVFPAYTPSIPRCVKYALSRIHHIPMIVPYKHTIHSRISNPLSERYFPRNGILRLKTDLERSFWREGLKVRMARRVIESPSQQYHTTTCKRACSGKSHSPQVPA